MNEALPPVLDMSFIGSIPGPDVVVKTPMSRGEVADTLRAYGGEYLRVDANGLVYVKNASGFQFVELTVDVFPVDSDNPPPMLSLE